MPHVTWSYFCLFYFTRRTPLKRPAGRWSFCAGVILCVFSLSAQTRQFRAWSSNEGLSQCFVKAIYKDSSDRLWIGTAYGLNQFLGNSIRLYKNYGFSGGRKPSNFMSSDIVEEPGGCLLLTMKDGVYRFDPARQRFSEIQIETGSGLPNELSRIGTASMLRQKDRIKLCNAWFSRVAHFRGFRG
jgi:ligand-binding sensor domain-containing protein